MTTGLRSVPKEQDSYLAPDVPPYAILPPAGAAFANATWLRADSRISGIMETLLAYEEFSELRGLVYSVVWRRNGKPMRNGEPVFATVEIAPPRMVWEATQRKLNTFPRYIVDLRWPLFDDMRRGKRDGDTDNTEHVAAPAEYVHQDVLARHIHSALMGLEVDSDIIHRRQPDFSGFAATVKRYGQFDSGIAAIALQLALWPDADE